MPTYKYTARNPATGSKESSTVDAQSSQEAAGILKKNGLIPIDLKANSSVSLGFSNPLNRVKGKDKVLFARQLSTLINAGLPLSQALRNVGDQTNNKTFKSIISQIIVDVEGGKPLSQSLAKRPDVFNKVFISLVSAGEASGTLDKELERIAVQQEKDADTISKVRGAMIYPSVVMVVMFGVITFMIIKVIPQIQLLYTSFPGHQLPILTRILIDFSKIFKKFWWLIIVLVVVLGLASVRWFKTSTGSRVLDSFKFNAPPFKELFRKIYMARFCRTTASLIGAGVPLLQVLQIASETVSNYYVSRSITKAAEKVKGGKSLGDVLTGDPYFLPLVPSMLKIGEKSGTVEDMMTKCAEYYEAEIENIIKGLSSIIEPILMVILGVVAIIIVIAILYPIYGLASSGGLTSGSGV
jgi:type IV pilus assembly protein PilC